MPASLVRRLDLLSATEMSKEEVSQGPLQSYIAAGLVHKIQQHVQSGKSLPKTSIVKKIRKTKRCVDQGYLQCLCIWKTTLLLKKCKSSVFCPTVPQFKLIIAWSCSMAWAYGVLQGGVDVLIRIFAMLSALCFYALKKKGEWGVWQDWRISSHQGHWAGASEPSVS